jgi:hypothetical protein
MRLMVPVEIVDGGWDNAPQTPKTWQVGEGVPPGVSELPVLTKIPPVYAGGYQVMLCCR